LVHVEASGENEGVYHAFMADLETPIEEVMRNEGVRAEFFTPQHANALPQHPVSRIFLRAYMAIVAADKSVHQS